LDFLGPSVSSLGTTADNRTVVAGETPAVQDDVKLPHIARDDFSLVRDPAPPICRSRRSSAMFDPTLDPHLDAKAFPPALHIVSVVLSVLLVSAIVVTAVGVAASGLA
jgi:hypothetical protein